MVTSPRTPHPNPVAAFTPWVCATDTGHRQRMCSFHQHNARFPLPTRPRSLALEIMNFASFEQHIQQLSPLELAVLQAVVFHGGEFEDVPVAAVLDYLVAQSPAESPVSREVFRYGLWSLIGTGLVWGPDTSGWYPVDDGSGRVLDLPPARRVDRPLDELSIRRIALQPIQLPLTDPVAAVAWTVDTARQVTIFHPAETSPGALAKTADDTPSTLMGTVTVAHCDDAMVRTHSGILSTLPAAAGQIASAGLTLPEITDMVAGLSAKQQRILTALSSSGSDGKSTGARPDAPADHPVKQLIDSGLLLRIGEQSVRLEPGTATVMATYPDPPLAAGMRLDYRFLPAPSTMSDGFPATAATTQQQASGDTATRNQLLRHVDAQAFAHVLGTVQWVNSIAAVLRAEPIKTQRTGFGVKNIKQLRQTIAGLSSAEQTQELLRLALIEGSLILGTGDCGGTAKQPLLGGNEATAAVCSLPLAQRLATLIQRWMRSSTIDVPSPTVLADLPAEQQSQWVPFHPRETYQTFPGADTRTHPWKLPHFFRPALLATIATFPPGTPLDPVLLARTMRAIQPTATWITPALISGILAAGETVGLIADNTATSVLYTWAEGGDLAAAFATHLPTPITQFIVQGDRSIIAPGPLTGSAAELVTTVAEVETFGIAATYRITVASVSRATRHGHDPLLLLRQLTEHSMTPIPDTVRIIFHDVARSLQQQTPRSRPQHCDLDPLDRQHRFTTPPLSAHDELDAPDPIFWSPETTLTAAAIRTWVEILDDDTPGGSMTHSRTHTNPGASTTPPTRNLPQPAATPPVSPATTPNTPDRHIITSRPGEHTVKQSSLDHVLSGSSGNHTGEQLSLIEIAALLREHVHTGKTIVLTVANRQGLIHTKHLIVEKIQHGAVTGHAPDGTSLSVLLSRIRDVTVLP
ncbi:hypothetical protein CCHOA_03025 [Corynebacterium choanae]|uniref:Helicase XPB/Ssl2 N-terminal domain-containing protein n=2 Tax=Corynebacterium choanae TaxID=1862358 RepID=A0A3G6J7Z5_9CORY|nr:hypothetical protein CCHOA_03025 [Corynebacterium choanae]